MAEVGGEQGVRDGPGDFSIDGGEQLQDAVGVVGVALLAGERGQAEQAMAADELADGVALSLRSFWRTIKCLGVFGGGEQPALLGVPEPVEHRVGRLTASSIQRASPVGSARRMNASTSAA